MVTARLPVRNPGSPRVSVEVSLGKTLNPELLPMYRFVPCMVPLASVCECVYMNVVNVMHNLCEAPWIKALYKCSI